VRRSNVGRFRASLPEHTVDCWVSAAIIARYPEALLWAPTQRSAGNWDLAFQRAGRGRCLVLENKGAVVNPNDPASHRIFLDLEQLSKYLRMPGPSVYYVLPNPPWPEFVTVSSVSSAPAIPSAAACRTGTLCRTSDHAHGPFPEWAVVLAAQDLYGLVEPDINDGQRSMMVGCDTIERCRDAVSLRVFLDGLESGRFGGVAYRTAAAARQDWERQRSEVPPLALHTFREKQLKTSIGSFSVFVPTVLADRRDD
jgi:hypothetical protein